MPRDRIVSFNASLAKWEEVDGSRRARKKKEEKEKENRKCTIETINVDVTFA